VHVSVHACHMQAHTNIINITLSSLSQSDIFRKMSHIARGKIN